MLLGQLEQLLPPAARQTPQRSTTGQCKGVDLQDAGLTAGPGCYGCVLQAGEPYGWCLRERLQCKYQVDCDVQLHQRQLQNIGPCMYGWSSDTDTEVVLAANPPIPHLAAKEVVISSRCTIGRGHNSWHFLHSLHEEQAASKVSSLQALNIQVSRRMQTHLVFCMQLSLTSTKASNVSTGATACTCRWELQRQVTPSTLKKHLHRKVTAHELAFLEPASIEEGPRHHHRVGRSTPTSQLRTSKLHDAKAQHTSSPPSSCKKSPMVLCCAAPPENCQVSD